MNRDTDKREIPATASTRVAGWERVEKLAHEAAEKESDWNEMALTKFGCFMNGFRQGFATAEQSAAQDPVSSVATESIGIPKEENPALSSSDPVTTVGPTEGEKP